MFNDGISGSSRKIDWSTGGQLLGTHISYITGLYIHCSLTSLARSILEHFTFSNFVWCMPWENVPSFCMLSPSLTDSVACTVDLWTLLFCCKLQVIEKAERWGEAKISFYSIRLLLQGKGILPEFLKWLKISINPLNKWKKNKHQLCLYFVGFKNSKSVQITENQLLKLCP